MLDDERVKELIGRAEDIIMRLRDIQSCSISTDETGKISEVHVVASTERSPKMIARDVETALKAKLGLNIDYRKIGVVLINSTKDTGATKRQNVESGNHDVDAALSVEDIVETRLSELRDEKAEPSETPRLSDQPAALEFLEEDVRVRFRALSVNVSEDRVDVRVQLEKSGIETVGCLGAARKSGPIHETIAGATVHALMELLDENFILSLSSIEEVEISSRRALLAVVDLIDGRSVKSYTGCAFVMQEANEAAVLAVLDALNRPLGRWKSRKEIHYTIK